MHIERRQIATQVEVLSDRVIRFRASTNKTDRHGTIVVPAGIRLENYLQNPVFVWAHAEEIAPQPEDVLGRTVNLERSETGLVVDVEFAPAELNAKAEQCLQMVRARYLNAISIAFGKLRSHEENGVKIYDETDLLEISLVIVPSNPEALALRALRGSMKRGEACKALGIEEGASQEDKDRAIRQYLEQEERKLREAMAEPAAETEARADKDPDGDGDAGGDADGDGDGEKDPEKRGLRAAVKLLTAEVGELRAQIEKRGAGGDDAEQWVDLQIKDGRYPKAQRATLLAERRRAPAAAETLVEAIPKGHFNTRSARLTEGGAPIGTTVEQAQPGGADREAAQRRSQEILHQVNAQLAERRRQGLGMKEAQ